MEPSWRAGCGPDFQELHVRRKRSGQRLAAWRGADDYFRGMRSVADHGDVRHTPEWREDFHSEMLDPRLIGASSHVGPRSGGVFNLRGVCGQHAFRPGEGHLQAGELLGHGHDRYVGLSRQRGNGRHDAPLVQAGKQRHDGARFRQPARIAADGAVGHGRQRNHDYDSRCVGRHASRR